MAILKKKTDFAKRVDALGLTIVELAERTGYKKSTLYNYSCGYAPVPPTLLKMLDLLEAEHAHNDKVDEAIEDAIQKLKSYKK